VRLSYRVAGAPLALGIAYVLIPFSLGIVAARGDLRHAASALTGALFLLFAARIVLKDFRDRDGDALYGKPTLLLRYGRSATCRTSLAALVAADIVLAIALDPQLVLLLQPFVAAIAWMLRFLLRADDCRDEQVAIGLGARMGNGLLLCVLAWSVVRGSDASLAESFALTGALATAFVVSFAALVSRPQDVLIGYKG
jgi:4-hydroxybenzoate polyprenyltransferase